MAVNTITSANSIFTLAVAGLFPSPQQLQGYATDAAFDTEAAEVAQTVMGVDGVMSAGYVPRMTKQTISLQADSASNLIFEQWATAQDTIRDVYWASGIIILPGTQKKYTLFNGILSTYMAVPIVKKVLEARIFTITWGQILPAPYLP